MGYGGVGAFSAVPVLESTGVTVAKVFMAVDNVGLVGKCGTGTWIYPRKSKWRADSRPYRSR